MPGQQSVQLDVEHEVGRRLLAPLGHARARRYAVESGSDFDEVEAPGVPREPLAGGHARGVPFGDEPRVGPARRADADPAGESLPCWRPGRNGLAGILAVSGRLTLDSHS